LKYILTIAIPTYNRAQYLNIQLSNLIKQVNSYSDIEILVSDNCSNDVTESVVENYNYSFINYYKQIENIGLDGNVLSCYENAKGKYIWYLSDDDVVFEDSVQRVYDFISKHEFSVLAFSFCDIKNRIKCDKSIDTYRQYDSFLDDKSVEDFFKVIMISTIVVKKIDIDMACLKSLKPTIFPQITLCLRILQNEFCLIAHDMNLLFRETGYITHNFFELYCLKPREAVKNANYNSEIENQLLKHTEKSIKEFVKLSVLEKIGFYKSKEGLPYKSFKKGIKEYNSNISNLFLLNIIFLISKTPKSVILSIVYIGKFIEFKSIRKVIDYRDMLTQHVKKNIISSRSSDV
jgi:glycosyltransferase involved in cell wall biosynthesis